MTTKCPKCNTINPNDSKFCKECASPLKPPGDVSVTKTIKTASKGISKGATIAGKYQILQKLGEGGMGIVYKAKDSRLDRTVALKFLSSDLIKDKEAKHRFIQEAKAAAALEHPNICTVYEVDESDGQTFIAMSYIEGQSLKHKLSEGPLDVDEAKAIAIQVAEGLKEAHEKGIVHRDIKPANIMLTKKSLAKITDFGLAKLSWGVDLTKTSTIMGTIAYMSPEQARGEEVDHRTDIWSLGTMMYEMLAGERPFQKSQQQALIYAILNDKPTPLSLIRSDIPIHVEQVIDKALAKKASGRYQDIQELIQDLKFSITFPKAEKSIVVLPFEDMSPGKDNEYFSDGLTEEIISDLSLIHGLLVISRSSAMTYKGTKKKIKEIGKELNIQYVLEGSVRKAGNNLRITAQLIDAINDVHLWAKKYSGTLDDVFDIQEKVSRAVVESLRMVLMPSEEQGIAARPVGDAQAYDSYMRARHEIARWTEDSLDRAVQQLEMAMDIVGDNAVLHAGLGYAYIVYFWGGFRMDEATLQKAAEHAKIAVELDPAVEQGHFVLGTIALVSGEPQTSYNHFRKALSLNSNDSDTLFWMVQLCGFIGKPEVSEPLVERLLETDPLSPNSYVAAVFHHIYSGNFEGAMEPARKAMQLDPKGFMTRFWFFVACTYNHKLEELDPVLELWLEEDPDHSWPIIVSVFVSAQRGIEIPIPEKTLNELWQDVCAAGHGMPALYSMLNKKEEALNWLERGFELGFFNYPFLSEIDPRFENIREEPRFEKLMERVKHEWENFEV
jgi:serine/threonine protein kinase